MAVTLLGQGSMIKGLIMIGLGFFSAAVGLDPSPG